MNPIHLTGLFGRLTSPGQSLVSGVVGHEGGLREEESEINREEEWGKDRTKTRETELSALIVRGGRNWNQYHYHIVIVINGEILNHGI